MQRGAAQSKVRQPGSYQMGIEYRIQFSFPNTETVVAEIRRIPWARQSSSSALEFELRLEESDKNWPDATVVVEAGGVYFCDHCGGSGRKVLGEVVARLVSAFGPVTLDEL
jgi:hypothetical protein